VRCRWGIEPAASFDRRRLGTTERAPPFFFCEYRNPASARSADTAQSLASKCGLQIARAGLRNLKQIARAGGPSHTWSHSHGVTPIRCGGRDDLEYSKRGTAIADYSGHVSAVCLQWAWGINRGHRPSPWQPASRSTASWIRFPFPTGVLVHSPRSIR